MKYKIKKDTDFDKVVNQLRQKYCYMSEYEELINDIIIATKEVNALFPSEETENNNNYIPYGEKCKDCVYKNEQGNCWAIKAKCNPAHMFCDYRKEEKK